MAVLPFGLPPVVVAGLGLIMLCFAPDVWGLIKRVLPKKAAVAPAEPKSVEDIAGGLVEVMVKARAENDLELLNAAFATLRALIRVPEVKS